MANRLKCRQISGPSLSIRDRTGPFPNVENLETWKLYRTLGIPEYRLLNYLEKGAKRKTNNLMLDFMSRGQEHVGLEVMLQARQAPE